MQNRLFIFESDNWKQIPDDELSEFAQFMNNATSKKLTLNFDVNHIQISHIPFYQTCTLVRLKIDDSDTNYVYFIRDRENHFVYLNGKSEHFHRLNYEQPIFLNDETVLQYFVFFCLFVQSDLGSFLILESLDQTYLPDSPNALEVLTKYDSPIKLERLETGEWLLSAIVFYGGFLFDSKFKVYQTGMVEMLSDEQLSELPKSEKLQHKIENLDDLVRKLFEIKHENDMNTFSKEPDKVLFLSIESLIAEIDEINSMEQERKQVLQRYLSLLETSSGFLPISRFSDSLDKIIELKHKFPNFSDVIDFVHKEIAVSQILFGGNVRIPPILINGAAGLGKTRFIHELSKVLDTYTRLIDMASITASFELSGSTSSWRSAQPGLILETIYQAKVANPIIVLDELDKADPNGLNSYPPLGPLHSLLEPTTAKKFIDAYLKIESDCSLINWVATCNDCTKLPAPIRSRFIRFDISKPKNCQKPLFIKSIYSDILMESKFDGVLSSNLSEEVIRFLSAKDVSSRDLKKIMRNGVVSALLRHYHSKAGKLANVEISLFDFDNEDVSNTLFRFKLGEQLN